MRLKSALRRGVAAAVIAGIVVSSGIPAYAARWDIADGDITVKAGDAEGTNRVTQGEKDVEDTDTVITGKSDENTVTIDTSEGNVDVTFDDLKIDVSGKKEGDGSDDGPARESKAAVTVQGGGDATVELDGDNELKSGGYKAGLEKDGHEPEGTLTIKDDKGKDGSLTAEGGFGGAGIGGGLRSKGKDITGSGDTKLKVQGGVDYAVVKEENVAAVEAGFENLDKHLRNIRKFGQTVIVAINRFPSDTDAEVAAIETHCRRLGVGFAVNRAFSEGGAGAEELARLVVDTIEREPSAPLRFAYADSDSIEEKVVKVATDIYGATSVVFSASARRMMQTLERNGMGTFPVCIAKTQYSFSTDPKRMGAADGFELQVNDVIVNSGAEMIVVVAGDILRMPGLPKKPMALNIRIKDGLIEGLS